jgi:hypothetical protein
MYIDRVEFIDGGTDQVLPLPTNTLDCGAIASTEVQERRVVEGLLARVEHVYRIVVKPEVAAELRRAIQ